MRKPVMWWASVQLWAVQHFLLGRATLVVGCVCCAGCVGSNIL